MKKLIISVWAFIALPLFAQRDANIRIYPEQGNQQISKHIYGQFAEHLGSCIYGGLWVGPESDIPNTQGYRTDRKSTRLNSSHNVASRMPSSA